jgi:hypothetical protein
MKINHLRYIAFGLPLCFALSTRIFAKLSVSFVTNSPVVATASSTPQSLAITKITNAPLVSTGSSTESLVVRSDIFDLLDESAATANIAFKMIGKLLNYPNPFSLSTGQTEIAYRLTTTGYLTLKIYTLTGQLIYTQEITPSDYGGAKYNKIPISRATLGGDWVPPGVYLYVLVHEGKVLARNRMVIAP